MRIHIFSAAWWGPPRKFETRPRERRVSWLELFFDLVYVIAVSRITHHLSGNLNLAGFLEFICLFTLIFWGWLNGSLHHDLHGNSGLRTRLMTLWQMMIIAALAIVIDKDPGNHHRYVSIVFMIMQLFITYQWWSVGLYDKNHRRYSRPYLVLYLLSLALMGISLAVPDSAYKVILPLIILCNYAPPFISRLLRGPASSELNLSSSMFERLGLFTIIIFGELVLGVVNGISNMDALDFSGWLHFALAISLVFTLWWIFFTMIARRQPKPNFVRASLLEMLYIPALLSLSVLSAIFTDFFTGSHGVSQHSMFGFAIAAYLLCINALIGLLEYPKVFESIVAPMRLSLLITAAAFFLVTWLRLQLSNLAFLLISQILLVMEILFLNIIYYSKLAREGLEPPDDQT